MGRKKQIFIQLYTKDYTGDEKLRMCSPAAWGVYSYLLCLMNSSKVRGEYRLSHLERRPELKRSLTQRALTATSEDKRIAPFAEILQRQMPWKKTEILRALKELIFYGVVVLEEDAIIQPRMYRESGHRLLSDSDSSDNDFAPQKIAAANEGETEENEVQENGTEKGQINGSFHGPLNNKKNDFPAHAIAHTRYENMSYENNINYSNNNKSNIKDEKSKRKNASNFVPPTLEEVTAYFKERNTDIDPQAFWAYYEANGWVQSRGKPIKNWKACLITWEQRRGEFGDGRSRKPKDDIPMRVTNDNFDGQETW